MDQKLTIKTKCDGCVFLGGPDICRLDYDVYEEKGATFVDSYCRFKRLFTTSYEEIINEDKQICLIINAFGQTEGAILRKLPKEISNTPMVTEVLIASNASYSADTINKFKDIFKDTNKRWSVRFFKNEEEYDYNKDQVEDEMIKSINYCNWYIYKTLGSSFNSNLFQEFDKNIESNNNFLEVSDSDYYIRNKYAFKDLQGNVGIPFYEKLQRYEEYQKVLIKI